MLVNGSSYLGLILIDSDLEKLGYLQFFSVADIYLFLTIWAISLSQFDLFFEVIQLFGYFKVVLFQLIDLFNQ